jgi:hypothetical protein
MTQTHIFKTKLIYGSNSFSIEKEDNFSITIQSQEPDITISRISTDPEFPKKGDNVILIFDIENAGNGDAKDVRASINNISLSGTKLAYLGQIKSDENIPARFVLTADKSGIYSSELEVQYKANGQIRTLKFPFEINVSQKNNVSYYLWVLAIIIILVLFYQFFKSRANHSK